MNPVLQNAIARQNEAREGIAEAHKAIAEWEGVLAQSERFIADWVEFSGEPLPEGILNVSKNEDETSEKTVEKKVKNSPKEEVAERACEAISDAGKPLSRNELYGVLPAMGIVIEGKDPPVVLQTMLWRMKERIVHLKGHGYWPRDRPYVPAAYFPEPHKGGKSYDNGTTAPAHRESPHPQPYSGPMTQAEIDGLGEVRIGDNDLE